MTTYSQAKTDGVPTWIDLVSPNAEASRKFYKAVFGWEYDTGGPEFGGYTTARIGTRAVAGIVGDQPDAPPAPAAWGLYFASHDLDADVDKAVKLGAKVLYPAMSVGDFGSMVTLTDPTGAQFSFWKAGTHLGWAVANEHGATAWYELYTADAKKARDFYTALLGDTADLMPGGLEYYILKQGEDMLSAIMQIDPSWGNMPAQWVPYFLVSNIDESLAKVIQNGGKQMGGIDPSPFGRIAAVADPAGANFKLVEGEAAA